MAKENLSMRIKYKDMLAIINNDYPRPFLHFFCTFELNKSSTLITAKLRNIFFIPLFLPLNILNLLDYAWNSGIKNFKFQSREICRIKVNPHSYGKKKWLHDSITRKIKALA